MSLFSYSPVVLAIVISSASVGYGSTLIVLPGGDLPTGGVRVIDSRLFYVTDGGSLLSMNKDGSDSKGVYDFGQFIGDGQRPTSRPVQLNGRLYGMTREGGLDDFGTIYSIGVNGENYRQEVAFAYDNGAYPASGVGLTTDGSKLYGTTYVDGATGGGVLFSLDPATSEFQVLHQFSGGSNGRLPSGTLSLKGTSLYGTTESGGEFGSGAVFRIDVDGSNFEIVHSFHPDQGRNGIGEIAIRDNRLFGVTWQGGLYNGGTVYACNLDGSDFQVLHHFNLAVDGSMPQTILLEGNRLYGTTFSGGGTLFSVGTDGSDFSVLHQFRRVAGEIRNPRGPLASDGQYIYGTATQGGVYSGAIFAYAVPEPSAGLLLASALGVLILVGTSKRGGPGLRLARSTWI